MITAVILAVSLNRGYAMATLTKESDTCMKNLIVMSALTLAFTATSALAAGSYKQFFLVSGKEVSAETAIVSSLQGHEAFKCVAVESRVSKSGTSIGIKNIKKPKKND